MHRDESILLSAPPRRELDVGQHTHKILERARLERRCSRAPIFAEYSIHNHHLESRIFIAEGKNFSRDSRLIKESKRAILACVHDPSSTRAGDGMILKRFETMDVVSIREIYSNVTRNVFHIYDEEKREKFLSSLRPGLLDPSLSTFTPPSFRRGNNDNFVMRTNLGNCGIVGNGGGGAALKGDHLDIEERR